MAIKTGTDRGERLDGTSGDDLIALNGGNDVSHGGRGRDQLLGGAGNDTLYGGNGRDTLRGDTGTDVLYGGNDADRFIFDKRTAALDWVMDFQHDVDKLDLSGIDANTTRSGNQAFSWIGYQAFTGSAGQARVYQAGDNSYVALDVNGDARADMNIAFDNHPLIGSYDVIV